LEATVDEDHSVREAALAALAAIAPDDASVQVCMTDMLSCRGVVVRLAAIQAVGRMGKHAEPLLPRLRAMMKEPDKATCVPAALALWRVRGDKREVQPLFEKIYRKGKGERRVEAVEAMRVVEPRKEQLVMFVRLLEEEKGATRYLAMDNLTRAGREAREVRPEFEALLKHREEEVRQCASELLRQLQR
jgi:HEAT repeat protein